jgi:hypothetical protein
MSQARLISLILLPILLSGCAVVQNRDIIDLKTQGNLRRDLVLDTTIKKIERDLFIYSRNCTKLNQLVIDPADEKSASMAFEIGGFSRLNVGMLIEFKEVDGRTAVRGFSYYEHWAVLHIDKVIRILKNPGICQ